MIHIELQLNDTQLIDAKNFEAFRNDCKTFLANQHLNFDKFTIVQHDTFIGYVTEWSIKEYLSKKYASKIAAIQIWEETFDLAKVKNIIASVRATEEDVVYVKRYFYDQWDLKVTLKTGTILHIDVKTAFTHLTPNAKWNFMYPVVQANKTGKDLMLLAYYVVSNKTKVESVKALYIVGIINEQQIRRCPIIKAGTTTKFGTVSQIDNYLTELNHHYSDINALF